MIVFPVILNEAEKLTVARAILAQQRRVFAEPEREHPQALEEMRSVLERLNTAKPLSLPDEPAPGRVEASKIEFHKELNGSFSELTGALEKFAAGHPSTKGGA